MPTERRLAAIVFADIVGWTAATARPLVEKYRREAIEARGDESLLVFPTAPREGRRS